jgi:alpha-N-arabinofuranosidase
MADTVFTACFLNACNRHCDVVGMANFAPIVNTRGCIYTHKDGIVLRGTYHVFDLYVNLLGETVTDAWSGDAPRLRLINKAGREVEVDALDILATVRSKDNVLAIAAVNKDPVNAHSIQIQAEGTACRVHTLTGDSTEAYNGVGHTGVSVKTAEDEAFTGSVTAPPHSVNIIEIW